MKAYLNGIPLTSSKVIDKEVEFRLVSSEPSMQETLDSACFITLTSPCGDAFSYCQGKKTVPVPGLLEGEYNYQVAAEGFETSAGTLTGSAVLKVVSMMPV